MPLLISAIIGALVTAMGTLVGQVLISLGIGYFTYKGVDVAITFARDAALARISALPANAVAIASAMKVGVCLSILTSALVMRMTLKGMKSGVVKRMGVK